MVFLSNKFQIEIVAKQRMLLRWGARTIWTDAGGGSERILAIPFDATPKGGTEVYQQWIVAALKVPVNGTYECRIRVRSEANALDTM